MGLSAAEQYLLELINRARLDPQAEANRYGVSLNSGLQNGTIDGTAKQVLAPNAQLESAAVDHSKWMLSADTFSHTGSGGSNPGERMTSAGYQFSGSWTWRENLAWTGSTGTVSLSRAIEQHHEGLYRSAGHRANTFAEDIREVGLAQVAGKFTYQGNTYNASMLTEKFAKSGGDVYITGVAYNDNDGDWFYSIGEGRQSVKIIADGENDTTTGSGGYAVAVGKADKMAVKVVNGTATWATLDIDTSDGNAKLDVVRGSNNRWQLETSTDTNLKGGLIKNAKLLGEADIDLDGSAANNRLEGNRGNNEITGGNGKDVVLGMAGNDLIFGNSGWDSLNGGNGNDRASGGDGSDRVVGHNGTDKLWGNKGNDRLWGNKGNDTLYGGNGDDRIDGGLQNDQLFGGSGRDTFVFNKGSDRIRDFQNDIDTIAIVRGTAGNGTTKSDILADGRIVNGNAILEFDNGETLRIDGVNNLNILANDLTII